MATFKYMKIIVTNQNYIHEEMKNMLKMGNASYCSVQNLI